MTSIIRSAVTAGAAFVLVGGLAVGGTQLASPASAETPATAATATPTATAPATATPSASTTATPSAAATATPTPTPSSTTPPAAAVDPSSSDPSLAVQNANGNHAMGSTIAANDPAAAPVGTTGATTVSPKLKTTKLVAAATTAAATTVAATKVWPAGLKGLDVSGYQSLTTANWTALANAGAKFAYVKATEGTSYISSSFKSQYNGAYAAGMVRGAYVFANPTQSSGAAQANYLLANGGNWTADGRTLPPLLDIEYGYNSTCWGLSPSAMVSWISSFSNTILAKTGIRPAIYTTANWWNQCTGSSKAFSTNPFFVAQYPTSTTATSKPASLGASWSNWTFWQWSSTGPFAGDSDVFNGSATALTLLAKGGGASVPTATPNAGAIMAAGTTLTANHSITSSNGQYVLTMQSDGNLVLRGNGSAIWQSRTPLNPGAKLVMQTDGNLVIYAANNTTVLWVTNTDGDGASPQAVIQSNGDFQVTTVNGVAWHNGFPGTATIAANTKLTGGQFLHDATGLIQTVMQTDGNFVVYISGKARYNTHTNGLKGSTISLQGDGNLVLRDASGKARWATNTARAGAGSTLTMQGDGNLVLRSKAGKAIWSTGSHI